MDRKGKLNLLARLMVDKHGYSASHVAVQRVRESLDARDYSAARVWLDVAEAVAVPPQSALGQTLDGSVTKAVMDADGVQREDVESAMLETTEKLDRSQ